MFFGAFNMQLQDDGALFQKYCKYHILASKILELKGKTCTVYFDKEHTEIIFSFYEEDFNDETYVKLSSFITEGDYKKLRRQFCIPKDYLKYYPDDKTVRIIGLDKAFCLSRKESENEIFDYDELKRLLLEFEDKNNKNKLT